MSNARPLDTTRCFNVVSVDFGYHGVCSPHDTEFEFMKFWCRVANTIRGSFERTRRQGLGDV